MTYKKIESEINNIAKLRKKKKLTIKGLADISKLNETQIAYLERDVIDLRKSNLDTVIKLCDALQCTPIALFKGNWGEKLLRICRKNYNSKIVIKDKE